MLEIRQLSVTQRIQALEWQSEQAELVALIGPNGSGKSTLLAAIADLIPCQGEVRLQAQSLIGLDCLDAARLRAMLPQQHERQLPLSCLEVLRLGMSMLELTPDQWQPVVHTLCDRLDLQPLLRRDFSRLSGGEQQRVLVAKTLLQVWPDLNPQARLLLMDEPLAGLDWHHQLQVLQLCRQLVSQGVWVLFSVHDFNLALTHADSLLCLQQGQLVAHGPVARLDAGLLEQVFRIRVERLYHQGRPLFLPVDLKVDDLDAP